MGLALSTQTEKLSSFVHTVQNKVGIIHLQLADHYCRILIGAIIRKARDRVRTGITE